MYMKVVYCPTYSMYLSACDVYVFDLKQPLKGHELRLNGDAKATDMQWC
jgi:hypothetical protein